MAKGRPKAQLILSEDEREQLRGLASSRTLPHDIVRRAKIILLSDEGMKNIEIAKKLGFTYATVGKWRSRFLKFRIEGLHDELRPGRPRSYSDDQVAGIINKTLQTKPKNGSHWSTRSMAKESGMSKSHVNRIWKAFLIQPHRQQHFKLSTDPFFVEKLRDVVGLYLNPPDKALVLCVDEKTQIQALERTQPMLPLGLGFAEGVTHDYVRHGTTTLFAALNVESGKVLAKCVKRHRHQEFLSFLKDIDENVPDDLDVHLVLDNYSTHKHMKVKRWLLSHKRFHLHFTPTYSSWLNQVEIWFNIITNREIRRGSDRMVSGLVDRIRKFVDTYNKDARPFSWVATADSILQKLKSFCSRISGTRH